MHVTRVYMFEDGRFPCLGSPLNWTNRFLGTGNAELAPRTSYPTTISTFFSLPLPPQSLTVHPITQCDSTESEAISTFARVIIVVLFWIFSSQTTQVPTGLLVCPEVCPLPLPYMYTYPLRNDNSSIRPKLLYMYIQIQTQI